MSQPDPLHLRAHQEMLEDIGDPPTRADLLQRWLSGVISLDEYAALMETFYPMTAAEARAARSKPFLGTFDAIIARREAERDAAKGGLP